VIATKPATEQSRLADQRYTSVLVRRVLVMNTLQRTLATLALFAVAFSFTTRASAALPAKGTEILWDRYGIPHIFASDHASLFYAYGYAQMEAHSELLVRLYTQARGRAAELYGEQYLDSDRWVRVNGIPERAKQWATRQSPNRHPTVRN
jgi:acyl-homoserine-lactone acylase